MPPLILYTALFIYLTCVCVLSCVQLFATPWTAACQAPLSTGFSRQEYWSGLLFPTLGDLPDPGIKPASLASPALAGGFLTIVPPGKQISPPNLWLIFLVSLWPADKWKSKE